MSDLASGALSERMKPLFLTSRGIAIPKAGNRIRAICVGDVIWRITSQYVVKSLAPQIAAAAGPEQLGYGVPGGVEAMAHIARAALTADEPLAVAKVDITNAFLTRHKSVWMADLYANDELAPMRRLIHWGYESPRAIVLPGADGKFAELVLAEEGVLPGDPGGTASFDVSYTKDLRQVMQEMKDVLIFAVHDDTFVITKPARVPAAIDRLAAVSGPNGSVVAKHKSLFGYLHDAPLPQEVKDWLNANEMPLETKSMVVAGAIISKSLDDADKFFDAAVEDYKNLLNRILSPNLPTQHAMLLFRLSAAPKFAYLARTTAPEFDPHIGSNLQHHAFSESARMLHDAIRSKVRVPEIQYDDEASFTQLHVPIRFGGFGMRTASLLPGLAYYSSIALCAPILRPIPFCSSNTQLRKLQLITQEIRTELGTHESVLKILPPSDSSAIEYYAADRTAASKLHAQLTTSFCKDALKQTFDKADPADKARLISAATPESAAWLTALPTSKQTQLTDDEYELAVRLRLLHSAPASILPTHCPDCKAPVLPSDPWHALHCHQAKRRGLLVRHDAIVRVLAKLIKTAGGQAQVEPRNLQANTRTQPDISAFLSSRPILVDVTVRDPLAPSHRSQSNLLDNAANAKTAKYEQLAAANRAEFYPFALDSFGRMQQRAELLLSRVKQAALQQTQSFDAQYSDAIKPLPIISSTLQRHNARICLTWLARAGLRSQVKPVHFIAARPGPLQLRGTSSLLPQVIAPHFDAAQPGHGLLLGPAQPFAPAV